jgi:hypothetical protein
MRWDASAALRSGNTLSCSADTTFVMFGAVRCRLRAVACASMPRSPTTSTVSANLRVSSTVTLTTAPASMVTSSVPAARPR